MKIRIKSPFVLLLLLLTYLFTKSKQGFCCFLSYSVRRIAVHTYGKKADIHLNKLVNVDFDINIGQKIIVIFVLTKFYTFVTFLLL